MDLDWTDTRGRIVRHRVISLYMPHSKYPEVEYLALLESLQRNVLDGCQQDSRIPIIGTDMNGSMGIYKSNEAEIDGSDRLLRATSPIGPYGIEKTNRNGDLFKSFLSDNGLCSSLMWAKLSHTTWRHPRYGRYHLDHICVPRKHLHRVKCQGTFTFPWSDHDGVYMQLVSEAKLLPKDLAEIRWDREQKRQELKERPPDVGTCIHKDPVLKSRLIADLEATHMQTIPTT